MPREVAMGDKNHKNSNCVGLLIALCGYIYIVEHIYVKIHI